MAVRSLAISDRFNFPVLEVHRRRATEDGHHHANRAFLRVHLLDRAGLGPTSNNRGRWRESRFGGCHFNQQFEPKRTSPSFQSGVYLVEEPNKQPRPVRPISDFHSRKEPATRGSRSLFLCRRKKHVKSHSAQRHIQSARTQFGK